jgi:hypothetical protein
MKIEVDFTNLSDVIYAFYGYELNADLPESVENSELENFVGYVNKYLKEFKSGTVKILEGN